VVQPCTSGISDDVSCVTGGSSRTSCALDLDSVTKYSSIYKRSAVVARQIMFCISGPVSDEVKYATRDARRH